MHWKYSGTRRAKSCPRVAQSCAFSKQAPALGKSARTRVGPAAALAAHVHLLQRNDVGINGLELLNNACQLVATLNVPAAGRVGVASRAVAAATGGGGGQSR